MQKNNKMSKKKHYNLTDSHKKYLEVCTSKPLSEKEYLIVAKRFMKFIASELINKGSVTLPERLGTLSIKGTKIVPKIEDGKLVGLAPDWGETQKLWKVDPEAKLAKQVVYHFNEDTSGIRYRLSWEKGTTLIANKTLYNFRLTRENKRNLSKAIKEGKEYLIR